jgi:hypothetical protein
MRIDGVVVGMVVVVVGAAVSMYIELMSDRGAEDVSFPYLAC